MCSVHLQARSLMLDKVVKWIVEIIKILRARGPLDHEGRGLNFLYWREPMDDQQKDARALLEKAINAIKRENTSLSDVFIRQQIVSSIVGHAVWYPKDVDNLDAFVETELMQLVEYQANVPIDVPVIYLDSGPSPVKFGLVTFCRFQPEDKKDLWWQSICNLADRSVDENVVSYARVICPGDQHAAMDFADAIVDGTLTFLRAVGFPITTKPQLQFGVLNDYPSTKVRPYRLGKLTQNYHLQGQVNWAAHTGPGIALYRLREDLLAKCEASTLDQLQQLMESDFSTPHNAVIRKFFLGLHWLGEATKPDSNNGRFAKLAFALEALIGGEANQDTLSTRGLTATLAERGAFLTGKDRSARRDVHDAIYKFYGRRSGIVHGNATQVLEEDLVEFSRLVRTIAWALLARIHDFEVVEDIQRWVLAERYS
jgi:hypothetical protein